MTNYNDSLWHGWNGGECPVHPKTVVEILTTYPGKNEGEASTFLWAKADFHGENIVAFRVVKEHREPREWWIMKCFLDSEVLSTLEDAENAVRHHGSDAEIIHVREVIE